MAEIINFEETQVPETPKFDPSKQYTWTENDTFTISGGEFGLVLNALRAITSTQEAQSILLAVDANNVITGVLGKAVEAGQVKELLDNPQNSL
jgi:hypothetical protein